MEYGEELFKGMWRVQKDSLFDNRDFSDIDLVYFYFVVTALVTSSIFLVSHLSPGWYTDLKEELVPFGLHPQQQLHPHTHTHSAFTYRPLFNKMGR